MDEAIRFAHEAEKEWAETSLQQRAAYLYKWADELVNMQEEIADLTYHYIYEVVILLYIFLSFSNVQLHVIDTRYSKY